MSEQKISLGDEAKDTITGFSGIVVAVTKWLHGCERVTIQPKSLHDGSPIEPRTFDAPQCELVTPKAQPVGDPRTGGPRPEPSRGR